MFEWLKSEIEPIRWPNFHKIGLPLNSSDAKAVRTSPLQVPLSYKEFIVEFRFARLFRTSRDGYRIHLWSEPVDYPGTKYGDLLAIARYEMGWVYFKYDDLCEGNDIPVYEWYGNSGLRKACDSFQEWLEIKFRNARRQYKSREWKQLLVPPIPFSDEEQSILAARRRFSCEQASRNDGDQSFLVRISNGSRSVLKCLTLDITHTNGSLFTSVFVLTENLLKDQVKDYRISLSDINYPFFEDLVAKMAPQPQGPEEREYYWEFQKW